MLVLNADLGADFCPCCMSLTAKMIDNEMYSTFCFSCGWFSAVHLTPVQIFGMMYFPRFTYSEN